MAVDKPGQTNVSGSHIQGAINNIGGTQTFQGDVTITMGNLSASIGGMNATTDDKAALQNLIAELEGALKQAPAAQQADAEKIAKRAKDAIEETAAEHPDQGAVEAKANPNPQQVIDRRPTS